MIMGSKIRTISQVWRDRELPPLGWDHALEADVPALDNLTRSENELERVIAVARGVELRTGGVEGSSLGVEGQPITVGATDHCRGGTTRTYIVHFNLIAWRGRTVRRGFWDEYSFNAEFTSSAGRGHSECWSDDG